MAKYFRAQGIQLQRCGHIYFRFKQNILCSTSPKFKNNPHKAAAFMAAGAVMYSTRYLPYKTTFQ